MSAKLFESYDLALPSHFYIHIIKTVCWKAVILIVLQFTDRWIFMDLIIELNTYWRHLMALAGCASCKECRLCVDVLLYVSYRLVTVHTFSSCIFNCATWFTSVPKLMLLNTQNEHHSGVIIAPLFVEFICFVFYDYHKTMQRITGKHFMVWKFISPWSFNSRLSMCTMILISHIQER